MNQEQVEHRLRAAYDATAHIAAPDFDVSRVMTAQPGRTRSRVLAMAAVAVVVVGVAALLYAVLRPADHPSVAANSAPPTAIGSPTGEGTGPPPSILPTAPVSTDPGYGASLPVPGSEQRYRPVRILRSVPSGHYESLPWRLMKVVDRGRAVRIEYAAGDGSCVLPRGIVVLESQESVELLALSERVVFPGATQSGIPLACPSMLATAVGVVRLAKPLRDRALLHAPLSPGWLQTMVDRICCPNRPSR